MPSPSKLALASGLVVTAGIFFGGAWLASGMTPETIPETGAQVAPEASPPPAATSISSPQTEIPDRDLKVTINGARNANGTVIVLVFDNEAAYDAYDYEKAVAYAELAASTEPITHTFSGLTSYVNAVVLIHDENDNYDLDMVDGYPVEGYGTSKAKTAYDELSFSQAAVGLGAISVKVHYLD